MEMTYHTDIISRIASDQFKIPILRLKLANLFIIIDVKTYHMKLQK